MKTIEELAKENILTMGKDSVMILPLEEGFTTFPLPKNKENCILISIEQYYGLLYGTLEIRDYKIVETIKEVEEGEIKMLYNVKEKAQQTMVMCLNCEKFDNTTKKCNGINTICFEYDKQTGTIIDGLTGLPIDPSEINNK